MVGIVTASLLETLAHHVQEYGTVVWYDPERKCTKLAWSVAPESVAGASVHCYEPGRGFLWLRQQLEPLWGDRTDPPRLLIYVPTSHAEAENALIEYEVAGVVLRPGQQPPEQNTSLATVARRGLAAVVPAARLEEIAAQVEAGQLSLTELDALAEKGAEALTGVIAAVFGTGNPQEVALRFLSDPSRDAEIESRHALASLTSLLSQTLGIPLGDGKPAIVRARVARQVLVTGLLEALGEASPPALGTIEVAELAAARDAAVSLARAWRNRRDSVESYVHWAGRVQDEIGLDGLDLSLDALARVEAFAVTEAKLQAEVEKALVQRPSGALLDLARSRQAGFWSEQRPEIKIRWEVIADAGEVLVDAARVEGDLKGKSWAASALLSGYVYGASGAQEPWCALDTAQRHLERDYHRLDVDPDAHPWFAKLAALARQRYAAVSDRLAELFTKAYAEGKFVLSGVTLQADVFQETVAPLAKTMRTAYILVDALRFEMARELLAILEGAQTPDQGAGWTTELAPALATPPTITEMGMAALLPGAERGLSTADAGGKLAPVVNGQTLRTRQDRINYLGTVGLGELAVVRLDQLAPLSKDLTQPLKQADVIVVTAADEIDGLCENNPALARRTLDDVLSQLRRGLRALFGVGIEAAVITADHGYLFGDAITSGHTIDAPGGHTVVLKRRVWVGKGGAGLPGVLRAPLSALGVGGELEIATPWNLSCFKAKGGSTEYFHGGLSLQELVIPVLTVRPGATGAPATGSSVQWTLSLGSQVISTRFVSATVRGQSTQLLPVQPPLIRVEVRAGDQPVSVPVSAKYGFQEATKDVQLQVAESELPQAIVENTITLMITEDLDVREVTVLLLDATTGVTLAQLKDVPVAISI